MQDADYHMEFLVKKEHAPLSDEMKVSMQAGEIVGKLYDAFYKQYRDPENEHSQQSLNALCVRLVFCLYAEDSGFFGWLAALYGKARSMIICLEEIVGRTERYAVSPCSRLFC